MLSSLEFLALLALLCCSAFFSGSETALLSLSDMQLQEMGQSNRSRARRAAELARSPHRILVTLLLANMLVNVLISVLATGLTLRSWGTVGLAVTIPAVTLVLLLFGEIVPKSFGLRRRQTLAENSAAIITALATLLGPVQLGLERLALAVAGPARDEPLDRAELSTLIAAAMEDADLTLFEGRVLQRILQFADTPIERCMTPRVDMITVDVDASIPVILDRFEQSGRSRLPVESGDPDVIVGILLLKDVLTLRPDPSSLTARDLMREAVFEPETLGAGELFRRFQQRQLHMAIVVGEHGGVEGLVTLEDLIEELIGDIREESDPYERALEPLANGDWRADATIELDDVAENLGLDVEPPPAPASGANTLSGLLQEELGRVPKPGDSIRWRGWEIQVLTASPNRPRLVRLHRLEAERGERP